MFQNGMKKYLNSMRTVVLVVSILLLGSAVYNYVQYRENKKMTRVVSNLNYEISKLEEANSNLADEKSGLENRIAELEESKENSQSVIEETRDDVDQLKNQVDDNYWDKWEMERKVRNLQDKVDELELINDDQ